MANPKLAMIPTGYKAGKVYSVLPESGVGDFTFDRDSKATRVNENGLIEIMDNDVPRLDYTDGGCPSLLLEPESTNLITQSELFSDASWRKDFITVSDNSTISADGTQNATLIQSTTTTTAFVSPNNLTLTIGNTYTFSCFAKKGNNDWIRLAHISSGGTGCWFDLENGVVGTVNSQSATIEDYGNGWYRCTNTFIATDSSSSQNALIGISDADGSTNSGIVGQNDYLWGAQLEESEYPTSYIPTNGSTVTRVAETCNGAGDASTFNDSEGVLMFEGSALTNLGTDRRIAISDGTTSNRVFFYYAPNIDQISAIIVSGGATQVNMPILGVQSKNTKFAIKYKVNDVLFWVNGFEIGTDVVATMPSNLSELAFDDGGGNNDFYGNTKQIQYFDSALTDAELETLTSWQSFLEMANAQNYTII